MRRVSHCAPRGTVGANAIHSTTLHRVSTRSPSNWTLSPVAPVALVIAGLATLSCDGGCERGCLSARLGDPAGVGGGPRGSRSGGGGDGGLSPNDLGGTDCSDGLARCVEGRVETSLGGHVRHPCAKPGERGGSCECPWAAAGSCANGCVKDGLEVVASADVARVQLCQPAAGESVLRTVLATESTTVSICADDAVSCADGLVRTCAVRGQPVRLVAACAVGCAAGIALEPGDLLTGDGPAMILCRRAHAERR